MTYSYTLVFSYSSIGQEYDMDLAGLHCPLEALGKDPLPCSFRLSQNSVPWGCLTEVPISLLTVIWGYL